MATTFTKIGSKVLITKTDPAESYLVEASANIRTEDRLKNKIIITEKVDADSDAGIVVDINDITNITFTSMADLLTQLATDFFFRVTGGSGVATGYREYLIPAIQITGAEDTFVLPFAVDTTKAFWVVIDGTPMTREEGITSVTMSGGQTTVVFDGNIASGSVALVFYIPVTSTIAVTTTGHINLTDDHTIELADIEKSLWMDSADAKSITVPLHADVAIPIDTREEFIREGAGTLTVVGAVGVTIYYPDGSGAFVAAGAGGVLVNTIGSAIKRGDNVWYLIGDLTGVA